MGNDGYRLEVFIYDENDTLVHSGVLGGLDTMEYHVEMLDESRKAIRFRQQVEELLSGNLKENAMKYEVYASFFKWGVHHDDQRTFTVVIRRGDLIDQHPPPIPSWRGVS